MSARIFLTGCFVSGLLAGHDCPKQALMGLAGLTLWAVWQEQLMSRRALALALAALVLGWGRAELDEGLWIRGWSPPEKTKLEISGTVLESPRRWGRSLVFLMEVESLDGSLDPKTILLVRWSGCEETVETGDRWRLSGRLTVGEEANFPGGFSQRRWLWSQRARGVFLVGRFDRVSFVSPPVGWGASDLAARLRLLMYDRLLLIKDERARALVCGVVFGDTQALPQDIALMFRRTGTSHLLAASGMNVALLIGIFAALARLFGYGPWRLAPALIPLVVTYAFLAGCAPSITRAATAGSIGLLAAWLGRRSGAWNSLSLSVWVLLWWEPRQLHDLGFGLSVAAVVGLLAGPRLGESSPGWAKSALLTVSATLLTLPFMWTAFHEISVTFLPANLLLGPLVELLFPLGLVLTLCPLTPLRWLTEGIARLSLWLVDFLSGLADPCPLAHPGDGSLALLYLAIAFWLGLGKKRGRWLAIGLTVWALGFTQWAGWRPQAAPGELVVRRIGEKQPYYWLSSHREELLVLTAAWQEGRARSSLVAMGCLRPVKLKVLQPGEAFSVEWRGFRWGKVDPLMPKGYPYLEVRTDGATYRVKNWRPTDDHRDLSVPHRLGKPRGELRPDSAKPGEEPARAGDAFGSSRDVLHGV